MIHKMNDSQAVDLVENSSAFILEQVSITIGQKEIVHPLHWAIPKGQITTLIGPNGCGKSTLLKAMTGHLKLTTGSVLMEHRPLSSYKSRELAQHMAFLPQVRDIPKDMTVKELVYCGRYAHQKWWKKNDKVDREVVESSLQATGTLHLQDEFVLSLSGGERQRVWIAMALAQEPEILILDEPTTYLDINHQLEVMELLKGLNARKGLTVIMVLHDLNQALQYSDHIGLMQAGTLIATGKPEEVMKPEQIESVFHVRCTIDDSDGTRYLKIHSLA